MFDLLSITPLALQLLMSFCIVVSMVLVIEALYMQAV